MICKCPAGTALPDIPVSNCPESFGQIQKVAFQRLYKSTGEKNSFIASAGIGKRASWTPLLSADDDTKIVHFPYIQPRQQKQAQQERLEVVTKHWEALRKLWGVSQRHLPGLCESCHRKLSRL